MAIKAFPLPDGSITEAPYAVEDVALLLGLHTGSYWAVDCGVVADMGNELSATVVGSQIRVATGWAMLNGFFYHNDATLTLSPIVPTTGTTSKRIVAQVVWDDPLPNNVRVNIVVLEGTDGIAASPTLIQLPGTLFQIPLWSFDIDIFGGITNLIDNRVFTKPSVALERTESSDTNPHGIIGWAVVDVLAGTGPTVVDSDGPVQVYEFYLDSNVTIDHFAVGVNVTEPSDDMTWHAVAAPYSGSFGVTNFRSIVSAATTLDPPGTDWQLLHINPIISITISDTGSENKSTISGGDVGRFIITWWGTQP